MKPKTVISNLPTCHYCYKPLKPQYKKLYKNVVAYSWSDIEPTIQTGEGFEWIEAKQKYRTDRTVNKMVSKKFLGKYGFDGLFCSMKHGYLWAKKTLIPYGVKGLPPTE